MTTPLAQAWFDNLGQLPLLLICIGMLALLIKGADWLVGGIAGIAYQMKISKAVVAATILSLGTTSPETAVSVTAAMTGNAGLALGNAVGSVICNLGLIFGLGCTLAALPADKFVLTKQGAWQLGAALLLSLLCAIAYVMLPQNPVLGRWTGIIMLTLLVGYIILSVIWGRQHPSGEPFMPADDIDASHETETRKRSALIAISIVGLLAVLISSKIFVSGITILSEVHWKIPKVVIAATIVAIGTSMPELVVSLTSVYKGHGEVLVGNVIGANVLNILFVTGAAATAAPLPLLADQGSAPRIFLWLHLPTMLLIVGLFSAMVLVASKRGRFSRAWGWPFLAIYVAYLAIQLSRT